MKPSIAWITYDLPYPPTSGGKMRAFNFIKRLGGEFNIHLFSFYRRESQLSNLEFLKPYVSDVKVYQRRWVWDVRNLIMNTYHSMPLLNISYLDSRLRRDLAASVRFKCFGLYHFEFLGAASYLPYVAKLGGRTVMGNENVEFQIYNSYAQKSKIYPLAPLFKYDVWKMRRFERELWNMADINLAVSQEDAGIVSSTTGKECYVVQNGVEIKENYPLNSSGGNVAFFSGDLNYQQNRDAVLWFVEKVLPLVKSAFPDFKLLVLSNSKPKFIEKYIGALEVVGDEDTTFASLVPQAAVFVSPIRIKSGTNIKVLQSAACGLPIVGTTASFAGYDFEDRKDVLVADDPLKFSESIIEILKDKALGASLSSYAFNKVKKYSWENSAKILGDVYNKILS